METIGWIGSMLFSFCALPQVIMVAKQKHARGLSWSFLSMWAAGEIMCFFYVWCKPITQWPLIANYTLNFLLLCIIIAYKALDRNDPD